MQEDAACDGDLEIHEGLGQSAAHTEQAQERLGAGVDATLPAPGLRPRSLATSPRRAIVVTPDVRAPCTRGPVTSESPAATRSSRLSKAADWHHA
jgi:hypothetical protein